MAAGSGGRRYRLIAWVTVGLGLPLACLLLPVVLFLYNNRPPRIDLPANKTPKVNGWHDLVRAGQLVAGGQRYRGRWWNAGRDRLGWTLAQQEAYLKANASALKTLRQGLAKQCMRPTVLEPEDDPRMFRFRSVARALVVESAYCEALGQYSRAMDSRLDCIQFGAAVLRGSPLSTGLVGASVQAMGARGIDPIVSRLTPAELSRAARQLDGIERRMTPFGAALREEAGVSARQWAAVFTKPGYLRDALDCGALLRALGVRDSLRERARFAFANKTALVRENMGFLQKLAEEQTGCYTGRSDVPVPRNVLAPSFRKAAMEARAEFARADAARAVLRVQLALRMYRADHGRLPAQLASLAPVYLNKVPADPCGGGPLRYRVLDRSEFVLYSIGPNLKDDGAPLDEVTWDQPLDMAARG